MNKKYNFIDLFAGCGGLSEGFMQSSHFNALAHVEWDYPMVQTLRNRLVSHWNHSEEEALEKVIHFDIQQTEELLHGNWSDKIKSKYEVSNSKDALDGGLKSIIGNKRVDLVIGGPPCQAYSIHGRATDPNSMKDDYRNYLFESFVKIVEEFLPEVFVFENVPGILTACPGGSKITDRINESFNKIGYKILSSWHLKNAIFDALDYSVPQNRKRVIIIGVRKNTDYCVDDFYKELTKLKREKKYNVADAIKNFPKIYPCEKPYKENGKNISHVVVNNNLLQHTPRYNNLRDISIFREWVEMNMNYLPNAEKIKFYKAKTGKETLYIKYRNLEWNKPSPTVVAHLYKDGLMFIHPDSKQARSITIREAASLMSFPMDFEFVGSMAYCYKMIGNAVPVSFAKAIGKAVYCVMRNKENLK